MYVLKDNIYDILTATIRTSFSFSPMAINLAEENRELRKRLEDASTRIAILENQLKVKQIPHQLPSLISDTSLVESEQSRKQLQKSKNRYRKYFNYANDAMFVISPDRPNKCFGRFADVNKEATRRLGYSREEFFTMTPQDINLPGRSTFLANLFDYLCREGSARFESTHITKDGRQIPVEISTLLLDIDGEELILAGARDISERQHAEHALRESERLYRLLADNVHDVIWTTDTSLKPIYISPSFASLSGFSSTEALPILYRSIILESPLFEDFQRPPRKSKSSLLHWELELTKKDNTTLWVESIASPLWDTSGAFSGIIGVTRDITNRKAIMFELEAAKEQANRANQAKSEFLANMSHEIRTPMNGVLGTLQLLGLTKLTHEQQEYVKTSLTSGNNLLTIINDILDFSKIEAGKITIIRESFDPRELVDSLIASFKSITQGKNLLFSRHISAGIPEILIADHIRLRQILFNLVGNAVKFTDSGELSISLGMRGKIGENDIRLECKVTDTGIGIPEQDSDELFEPFFQVKGSYRRKYKGTGLGLSIVKQLVTLMGGTVQITSCEGQGTCVSFDIVAEVGDLRQKDIDPSPPQILPHHGQRRLHILLAEDELINQQIIRAVLLKLGHSIKIVQNGRQALQSLREMMFDCVLMDIQMPELDGIEATRIIRTEAEYAHVADLPIVALTAFAMTGDREKCLSAGMNAYLSKPVDLRTLEEVLQQHTPLHPVQ